MNDTGPAMDWLDSHVHMDTWVEDGTAEAVLARAAAAGVRQVVAIGGSDAANARATALASAHPGRVFATAGYDRDLAVQAPPTEPLREALTRPGVVAVGETGLDYHYEPESAPAQKALFERQLELAAETRRPVVVHTRDADDDTEAMLAAYVRNWAAEPDRPGVIHCFTGAYPFARRLVDLGFYISVSGILTFRNADTLRDAVRRLPLDRLLIETDAPYLAPVPHRGKTNEPAWVVPVGETLASLHGVGVETAAGQTAANARYLFGVAKDGHHEGQ